MYLNFNGCPAGDRSTQITVPNQKIVLKVLEARKQDENLRTKAAGIILHSQIIKVAGGMRCRHIDDKHLGRNELGVALSLPPPPSPPPPPPSTPRAQQGRARQRQYLETIPETAEEDVHYLEWDSLYKCSPAKKREAMYLTVDCVFF